MHFRFYYKALGGHTHIRVFSGESSRALGKAGDLTMRNGEFKAFRGLTIRDNIEFIEEANERADTEE